MKNFIPRVIIFFIVFLLFFACKKDSEKTTEEKEIMEKVATESSDTSKTFYMVPSPEELFALVKADSLEYSPNLYEKASGIKYGDKKVTALKFGIYSADMAYSALYGRYQEVLKNIATIRDLSKAIGISSIFDKSLQERVNRISDNQDSLEEVTNTSYYKIINYLEKNKRDKTLAYMVAGGWVESLYIVNHLIESYEANTGTVQMIADQKLTFENLMALLNKHKETPGISELIADLQPIKEVYDSIGKRELEESKRKAKDTKDNAFVVGTNKEYYLKKDEFLQLKQAITEVRKEILASNS